MTDDLDIRLRLRNARRFSSDAKRASKDVDRIGDAADRTKRDAREAGGALRAMAANGRRGFGGLRSMVAAAGGLYAVGRATRFIASEYTEAARVGAQTGAVIESTGGVAGVTRRQVEGLSGALSRQAGIDDELVQSGANLLLTFKRVRNEAGKGNDVFDRGTRAALDLSVAFGKDMRSSVVMVGKALDDPIRGVTALRRVGVQLTAQQEEQIKTLEESGDTLGAQRIILKELESQVKGSAKAQAQPVDRMRVGFANLAESIGFLAAPTVNKAISRVAGLLDEIVPTFERDDITFGQKIEKSMPKIEQAFKRAEVGEALASAVEQGMPIVANAAARAAPRAAGAFVTGFKNAGPWGQLITVAFLANRMGAFNAAGSFAAGRFMNRFGGRLSLKSAFKTAAVQGATVGSSSGVATMAGTGKGSVATNVSRKRGGFRGAGRIAGKAMGAGAVIGFALFLPEIIKTLDDTFHGWFGAKGGQPSPSGSRDQRQRYYGGEPFDTFGGDRRRLLPPPRRRAPRSGSRGDARGARASSLRSPVLAPGAFRGGGGETLLQPVVVNLDGKTLTEVTAKHVRRWKASQ